MEKKLTKRQAKRLLNVARALRESPKPKAFSMVDYVWNRENAYNHECGTPQCALGHYGSRTDLQRLIAPKYAWAYFGNEKSEMVHANLVYRDDQQIVLSYWDTEIKEHFGIDADEAEELFGWGGCDNAKTPKQAARYIERFVRDHS